MSEYTKAQQADLLGKAAVLLAPLIAFVHQGSAGRADESHVMHVARPNID